jgi:iron complex outermembrane receptor protein
MVAILLATPAWCQQKPADISQLSIEDLMNIEVTSVSKQEQPMSKVAAAIFVIGQEQIRRSGATNIPDLLRMVPGLDVAQINANTWAISARGFNHELADKLLVLIDGRSVYTATFPGVNWDTQDVPLEDIDRIEVIRGPGGTIWGANAVNGVINVITKSARETHGALITAGGGTAQRASGTAQYGGKLAGDFSYRAFAKYLDIGQSPDVEGDSSLDGWHLLHGGFRVDGNLTDSDSLTIQGDIFSGREGAEIIHTSLDPPENVNVQRSASLSGGNILGRWSHTFSNGSDATMQFYFDNNLRDGPQAREATNTVDFDFQHHVAIGARHNLIWGAGYRRTADQTEGTIDYAYIPASLAMHVANSFLQDEITLKPDRLYLTLGTKLEHETFTGFNTEPSARLAWTLSKRQTFWAAVSRASRTPTRRETAGYIGLAAFPGPDGLPQEVVLFGNPGQKSEHVIANEIGYRAQISRRASIDVALFFNTYSDLDTREPGTPFLEQASGSALEIIPITWGNKIHGTTDGIEVSTDWRISNRWTVSPGYALLQMHLHADATSTDTDSAPTTEGSNPRHQIFLRSHVDLRRNFTWDVNVNYVDSLPARRFPPTRDLILNSPGGWVKAWT